MLGKLIKYEFKATGKLFLLLYAALLVMALINMATLPMVSADMGLLTDLLTGLGLVIYVLLIAAIAIVTLVVIIQRFYINLLGDEGYLAFTLPVNTHQHILSKLITATVWTICSGIMIVLSIFILLIRIADIGIVGEAIREINAIGINAGLWFFTIAILILVTCVASILQFYSAMSLGPHITKNRLVGSILAYIGIYLAMQVVSLVSLIPLVSVGGKFAELEQTAYGSSTSPDLATTIDLVNSAGFMIMAYYAVFYIIVSVAFYLITNHMLKNKLNLA